MKKFIPILFIAFAACNHHQSENKKEMEIKSSVDDSTKQLTSSLDSLEVDNKKDPSCGMPTKGHVADTTTYQGKLYGFCSSECKAEFLKNPAAHVVAAELK